MLIDTHAHLFWDSFQDDFDAMLQRAKDAGIDTVINVGVDVELSKKAAQQAIEQSNSLAIYSSIAIHPEDAIKYFGKSEESENQKIGEDMQRLEEIYHQFPEKVV